VFPSLLPDDGTLAFVKHLKVDRIEGKKEIWATPNCEPVLFGWQVIDRESREVVLTEGEIDALTSFDYGRPALSLPFGGGKGAKHQWIEAEYDRLAQFEVIHLALDNDQEGEIAADVIANRLGRHRCRRVRLPHKDLNACKVAGVTAEEINAAFRSRSCGAYALSVTERIARRNRPNSGCGRPRAASGQPSGI